MEETCLHGVAVYNPALWSRKELKRYFVARTETLDRIIDDLHRERPGSPPQHRLILGLRGMGKSTLLRRIGIAVEEDEVLTEQWLPLTFPEEQYNIGALADLWLNCLDALSDGLDERGDKDKAKTLDTTIEQLPHGDAGAALTLLLAEAGKLNQRLLLLIDNIDLVFERLKTDHWALREVLQAEPRLLIIGASAKAIEVSYKYDAAFYDFFKVDELKGLSETEMRATLTRLAELGNTPHVVELIEIDPGRIKTLHTLTGGNPRTIVLLYNVLARGLDGDVRSDLEGLLDLVTPLYKARFEEMPQQAQQLVDGLAVNWDPMTARKLAEKLGWDVNKTSSQLNRLQQQAIVEKVKPAEGKRAAFQIGERFFNIWYLMRASRRVRRKLIWLVRFLRMFFNASDLHDHACKQLQKQGDNVRDAEYKLALAQTVDNKSLQTALQHHALNSLLYIEEHTGEKLQALLDLQDEDAELRPQVERIAIIKDIRLIVASALKEKEITFDEERFCFYLLGTINKSLDAKQKIANKLLTLSVPELHEFYETMTKKWQHWRKEFLQYTDIMYQAIGQGIMASIDDIHGAKAAALQNNSPVLVAIAWVFWFEINKNPSEQHIQQAEKAYRKAIEFDPHYAPPWDGLGNLLQDYQGLYDEAQGAYKKAIEIDPDNAYPWNGFGNLLRSHFKRYDEAEQAYRRAIKISPNYAFAWNNLGNLLHDIERYDEAEGAYRNAIKLNPNYSVSWNGLGNVLQENPKRYVEAEQTYKKAIELDSNYAHPWNGLGNLLQNHLKKFGEAHQAYRTAIRIDPDYALAWKCLGNLMQEHFRRYDEAEQAYKKAIAIDPNDAESWNNYGNIQLIHKRYNKAEQAYRKAIEIEPKSLYSWYNMGNLLQKNSKRYNEAEQAYRKVIELDPNDARTYNNLAWTLYAQRYRLDEAVTLAQMSLELSSEENLDAVHTLSTILVANDQWREAEPHIRYLFNEEEFCESNWQEMLTLFKEAVRTNRAKQALQLFDTTAAAERWRPLREALAAAAESSSQLLNGVASEVRQPALEVLRQIAPDLLPEVSTEK